MPNTPCLIRQGTAVYTCSDNVSDLDCNLIATLCAPVFTVFEPIPEYLFNAAIGVAGSAPAYVCLFVF